MSDVTDEMTAELDFTTEPNVPGWYGYDGGAQTLMFLLDARRQWWAFTSLGDATKCEWAYVWQGLGVWHLVQHAALMVPTEPEPLWVCDGCLRTVSREHVKEWADGEHVLCDHCWVQRQGE